MMWCTVTSSSEAPPSAGTPSAGQRSIRHSGQADRRIGAPAAAFGRGDACRTSTSPAAIVAAMWKTGSPSSSTRRARSRSWRAATVSIAFASAGWSTAGSILKRAVIWYAAPASASSCSRNHKRRWPDESVCDPGRLSLRLSRRSRSASARRRALVPPKPLCREDSEGGEGGSSSAAHSAASVGCSKIVRTGTSTFSNCVSRADRAVAVSECPPAAKKSSSRPGSSPPSRSCQCQAIGPLQHRVGSAARGSRRRGVERRQRPPVHLAVGGQRHRVDDDPSRGTKRRRHHDDRAIAEGLDQGVARAAGQGAARGLHVRGEKRLPLRADLAADAHALDEVLALQEALDLAELHANAADLHLRVAAAEESQRAARRPARAIAGAVDARAGRRRTARRPADPA